MTAASNKPPRVIVLGRGVVGTTTAITLSLLGRSVRLCGRPVMTTGVTVGQRRPPEIASLHAAASVIPHSIAGNNIAALLRVSQLCFESLVTEPGITSVRRQRHYELFETAHPPALPSYAGDLSGLRRVSYRDSYVPRPHPDTILYGWSFDAVFCDMPRYLALLEVMADRLGIERTAEELTAKDLSELDTEVLVNCSGFGSVDLFRLGDNYVLQKGVWVLWRCSSRLLTRPVSYNYTPHPDIYSTPNGAPADVYCYPRSDGLLLGGTRLKGRLDVAGRWHGEHYVGDTVDIGGVKIPKPVLGLNEMILRDLDPDLAPMQFPDLVAGLGYRFTGADGELVVGKSTDSDARPHLVHNYGHGGSGVTLSWGSAYDVARVVRELDPCRPETSLVSLRRRSPIDSVLSKIRRTLLDLGA